MRFLGLLIIALGFVGISEAVALRSAGHRLWSVLIIVGSAMAVVGGAWLFERRSIRERKSNTKENANV